MRDLLRDFVRSSLLAVCLLGVAASPGLAQVGKLLPVDEAARDPEFFAFRARLQAAVARHDTAAVLEMIDPNIKNGFGGEDGIDNFQKGWDLKGGGSRLWAELGLVLALGGSFHADDLFMAPYTFSRFPNEIDAFQHAAVVGSDVRVRAAPSLESAVLATLSFDVVRLSQAGQSQIPAGQEQDWTSVELKGGRTGFIASRYVRSPIAHRAIFNRTNGRWRMTAFVAGD